MSKTLYQVLPIKGIEAFRYGYEEEPEWYKDATINFPILFGDWVVHEQRGEIRVYTDKEFWARYCIEEEIVDD